MLKTFFIAEPWKIVAEKVAGLLQKKLSHFFPSMCYLPLFQVFFYLDFLLTMTIFFDIFSSNYPIDFLFIFIFP